jgi:trigger factor
VKELRGAADVKIDDELAKKLRFESLDTLKDAIVKEIGGDYEQLSRLRLKRALLDVLDENHSFELPSAMVEMEYDSIIRQLEQEKKQAKEEITAEEREGLKPIAERRVRLGLVLAEIGNAAKVTVSQDELYKAVYAEARRYPGQEQKVWNSTPKILRLLILYVPRFTKKKLLITF